MTASVVAPSVSARSANPPREVNGLPVLWEPEPGFQMRFCASNAFETLGGGAAGPGKTSCLIALAAGYAQHPNARVIFLRTVYKDLLDVRDRMQALYPRIGARWDGENSRWIFPSGAPVMLAHGATMTEINSFLGPEYTAVLWDELSLVKDEVVWQMLLTRVRSTDPTVPLRARASANPVGPGKPWLSDRFIAKCGERGERTFRDPDTGRTRAYVPGTSKDNRFLPQSYWDGMSDLPPSLIAALRDGLWNSELGLFYPELSDPANKARLFIAPGQVPPLLDWHEYWGSYDWGFVHPAAFASFVRIKDTVHWLDTVYLHRYQDEEQAATIRGSVDSRCLRTVYAGHDAFAKRLAHSAAAETVADVFARYSISLERANIDRHAGAKVVRRFFAPPTPGPAPKGVIQLRIVDTPGNRRAIGEFAGLVPEDGTPNVPAKRDANEKGEHGDDGADCGRYGLATPTFEPYEPAKLWQDGNVDDGVDHDAPWEKERFSITAEGVIDKREYSLPRKNEDPDLSMFPGDIT